MQNINGGEGLRKNGRNSGASYAQTEGKDKNRIQDNVGKGTDHNRNHAISGIALGIDKGIQSDGYHRGKGSQEVNADIGNGIDQCTLGSTEKHQNGPAENHTKNRKQDCCDREQSIGSIHNILGFTVIFFAPFDGKKRRTAAAVHVGKGGDNYDQGKTKSYRTQGDCSDLRNPCSVNTIYNIVKQIQNLCRQHRHGGSQNTA